MRIPSSPVARTSKCVMIAAIVLGIMGLFVLVSVVSELEFVENLFGIEEDEGQVLSHHYMKEATTFSSVNDTAYVFLGLGATAHQMNCPAAVESLVRYGGWDGQIYMITDQANCFDKDLIIKNAGMKPENFHMITVKEDFGGGGLDITNPKVGFSKNRLRSKAMKTQLFDLIKDESIKVLAYVDCDIIFGVEGCPREYVTGGVPWEERKIRFSRVAVNPTTGRLVNIHTGSIMMHREHSREVLQRWYDRISTGVDDMDRIGYLTEYAAVQDEIDRQHAGKNETLVRPVVAPAPGGHLRSEADVHRAHAGWGSVENTIPDRLNRPIDENIMMPSERIMFDADSGNITRFEVFVDPALEYVPCMIHVSKARCDKFGRDAVQQYVDRFRLRTYEQGYPYCPNPIVAPILYGWFPLSYLPFCPKIESFY